MAKKRKARGQRMWATVDVESGEIQDVHTERPGRISPAYRGILKTVRVEVRITASSAEKE